MGAVESCAAPARGVQHIEKRARHCPSGVTCGLRGQATPVGGTNTGEREGARAGLRRVVLGECARQTSIPIMAPEGSRGTLQGAVGFGVYGAGAGRMVASWPRVRGFRLGIATRWWWCQDLGSGRDLVGLCAILALVRAR